MNGPILIAESGATKTEWRLLVDKVLQRSLRTVGFNPNVMTLDHIEREMTEISRTQIGVVPSVIWFYGAGIGGPSQELLMRNVLERLWPDTLVHIEHDLTAAARSTLREEGIVCIVGTGSNSCFHRQHRVVARRGGHGYLFGDEGSGMDLGRHLIMGLLQERFPEAVQKFVASQEGLSIYELKIAVLRDPQPNVRMARLAKYLDELLHYPEIHDMILERLLAFLDTTVCQYPDYEQYTVDVMGSIGWHFQAQMREAMSLRPISIGKFIQDPIDDLVAFHQKDHDF